MAQWVKNLPAMQETQETWVWSLSWEDPLEKETHSGIMAWKILWTEEPERLQPLELQRAGHDRAANTHLWTTRRSNQPEHQGSPKGNQPWILTGRTDAEAPILWPPDAKSQLIGKYPDAGKDWRQEEKRATDEATVGWHHRLDGYDSEQIPGDSEGHGGLVCCSPWGCKELDMTQQLNNNSLWGGRGHYLVYHTG